MAGTQVEFRHRDWGRLLTRLAENTIGRAPDIRISSPNRVVATFEPPLTANEKADLNAALPDWVKDLFEVELSEY